MENLKITVTTKENNSTTKKVNMTLEQAVKDVNKKEYPEDFEILISERVFDDDGELVECKRLAIKNNGVWGFYKRENDMKQTMSKRCIEMTKSELINRVHNAEFYTNMPIDGFETDTPDDTIVRLTPDDTIVRLIDGKLEYCIPGGEWVGGYTYTDVDKESLKVRDIYDSEGHTECVIMEESEIKKAVEKWLENNSFSDLLKKEGVFRYSQSFGNRVEVEIDTRTGEISSHLQEQNQGRFSDSFYLTLVSTQEIEKDESNVCEGDDMIVEIAPEQIIANAKLFSCSITDIEDIESELESEKLENGKYKMSWWGNQDNIDAEDFVTHFMQDDWSEWLDNYANYMLEDVGSDWEEKVTEHYSQIRDLQDYTGDRI